VAWDQNSAFDLKKGLETEQVGSRKWQGVAALSAEQEGSQAEAEESAETPCYQRSSASIRGSIFLFPADGSGQDALASMMAFDGGVAVTNRRHGPDRSARRSLPVLA
jgi:hypothetical protein